MFGFLKKKKKPHRAKHIFRPSYKQIAEARDRDLGTAKAEIARLQARLRFYEVNAPELVMLARQDLDLGVPTQEALDGLEAGQ